jgi:microcystin-dependent protein
MSDLITDEIFSDGQQNIAASNMNGVIGRARLQPDAIGNKVASSTLNVADQILILKTDNTLARARFDTIVNSTSSALPLADATKNGMLRQVSGLTTDFVDGTNNCQPLSNLLPAGVVVDYAGPNIPAGWLFCDGRAVSRTTYAALYAAIGGYYGAGDGSTTFNIPNTAGRIIAGVGGSFGALAAVGGAASASLAVGHLPSHTHPIADVQHVHGDPGHAHTYTQHPQGQTQGASGAGAWAVGVGQATATSTVGTGLQASYSNINTTQAVGSGAAFSILNPYIAMYQIIKY